MISSSILSKPLHIGRQFLTNNRNIGFLTPKIISPLLSNQFSLLKSQNAINLPEKPKKPASPFFKYIQDQRPVTQKEHPQMKLTEVVKKLSEDWKNIHSTVKEKYEIEYKEEMEAYSKKYMEYTVKLTEEQKMYIKELKEKKQSIAKKRKTKKILRGLNKPKKPPSAFLIYLMDQAKSQNRKINEIMKQAGISWENLEQSEKLQYNNQAKLATESYLKQLADWETQMLKEGNTKFVRVKTLEEKRPSSSKKAKDSRSKRGNNEEKKLTE